MAEDANKAKMQKVTVRFFPRPIHFIPVLQAKKRDRVEEGAEDANKAKRSKKMPQHNVQPSVALFFASSSSGNPKKIIK